MSALAAIVAPQCVQVITGPRPRARGRRAVSGKSRLYCTLWTCSSPSALDSPSAFGRGPWAYRDPAPRCNTLADHAVCDGDIDRPERAGVHLRTVARRRTGAVPVRV